MSVLRKIELSGGILTAVIGLFIVLTYIRLDQRSLESLGREFPVYRAIFVYSLLYLFPGLLVLLGSYTFT